MNYVESSMGKAGPKVGSFNCNGLGDKNKRNKVLNWLSKEDIIFLQETHSTLESESDWKQKWDGEIFYSHGTSNSTGVAILIKRNEHVEIDTVRTICQGRTLLIESTYNSVKYIALLITIVLTTMIKNLLRMYFLKP